MFFLLLFVSACTSKESNMTVSSREDAQEGLNIFNISEQYGVIEGAYIQGEYRVDFEARREGKRPLFAYLIDPTTGRYDVSACYISKEGEPFIVLDSCSVQPLCAPTNTNCEEINETIRTKEFQLAEQAAEGIKNLTFPESLHREQEVLIDEGKSPTSLNSFPVSSIPNN